MRVVDNPTFAANDGSLHKTIDEAAKHDALCIFDNVLDGSGHEGAESHLAHHWEALQGRLTALRNEVDAAKESERARRDAVMTARRAMHGKPADDFTDNGRDHSSSGFVHGADISDMIRQGQL